MRPTASHHKHVNILMAYNSSVQTRLKDHAYIVTGAASGIGQGVAIRVAAEGGGVVLADLNEDGLRETAATIEKDGGNCTVLAGDVTEAEFPERAVACAQSAFGGIDGCVPCAGIIKIRSIAEVTREEWEAVLELNLTAVFFLDRAVAEAAKAAGHGGAIVNLSSTSAHGARPNNVDYGVSKIGSDHVTRTLALEYGPSNIRVNAVSPGVIDTPMWRAVDRDRGAHLGLKPGELTKKMIDTVPMHRVAQPSEIAALVAFLLSDEAEYTTGQIIEMDGGFKLANP